MSGHGSFKVIGSYNPINTIHIGNVDNIQQPNANPPLANVGGAE